MHKRLAVIISGVIWFGIGLFLMRKGLFYIALAGEQSSILFVVLGLVIGFFKGRFVLAKSARRMTQRILTLPEPFRWSQVYPLSYYFLIGGMMAMGICLKWIPIAPQYRGLIDLAIGSALINGSVIYFRVALGAKKAADHG
jgi:hypothetical protein